MAYVYDESYGDGAQTEFEITFPYLDKSHVKVLVDGAEVEFTWFSDSFVTIDPAPAAGSYVYRYRETALDKRLVDFKPGMLTEEDLDTANIQAFYLAQEANDTAKRSVGRNPASGHFDVEGHRLENVGDPVNDADAVSKLWAETSMTATLGQGIAARDAAVVAQSGAEVAETGAVTAQILAEDAEDGAIAAQLLAEDAEANAFSSAEAAALSEVNVSASEANVTSMEANVTSMKNDVITMKDNVQALHGNVITLEGTTATNASAASNFADNAMASEVKAQKWAEEAEDVEVETGAYSAKHWAAKAALNSSGTAENIAITPVGNISATDVQAALEELDAEKATTADVLAYLNGKVDNSVTISVGTGLTGGGNLTANRTITPSIATQAEAEDGSISTKLMTPLRTKQAILANGLTLFETEHVLGPASGATVSIAHGLGVRPRFWIPIAVCVADQGGAVVGDEFPMASSGYYFNSWRYKGFWADETYMHMMAYGGSGAAIGLPNGSYTYIYSDNTNFHIKFRGIV